MSLKDDVKKKVPIRLQDAPEFATLLALLRTKDFADSRALRMYLDSEIARCRAWLNANKHVPSGNRQRRACANHLEFYIVVKERILPYLV